PPYLGVREPRGPGPEHRHRPGLLGMLLSDLASTSAMVASTSSRLAKVEAISACLRRASPPEVAVVVSYLSGELRQRRTGVGWAALRQMPAPAEVPTLEVAEVDQ